jgi:hypothetical protein
MWLDIRDQNLLVNLDHVMELKADGNFLRAVFQNGQRLTLHDFAKPEDAVTVLTGIKEALQPTVYAF